MKKINSILAPALVLLATLAIPRLEAQSGHWELVMTKNGIANRNECGLAAVNGKLYLIGGDAGEAKTVDCLDPKTLSWTTLAIPPDIMHHFQAVALGNKIYVLEAFSKGSFPDQVPLQHVHIYNTENNSWETGSGLSESRRRAGAGAAAYDGKLYLVDGIQHGHSSGTNNMFDSYDPSTDKWTTLPDAPHIRDHCSAAVVKGKLYVAGGRNTSYHEPDNFMAFFSHTVLEVDCFDFATGTWSTLDAKLPLGSGGGALVNCNDVLYYMGGERATATEPNAPRKNTYYLDPSTKNDWKETAALHYGRNGMPAAVINDQIYVAGGSGGGPGGPPRGTGAPGMHPADTSHRAGPLPANRPNGSDKITVEVFTAN